MGPQSCLLMWEVCRHVAGIREGFSTLDGDLHVLDQEGATVTTMTLLESP